MKVVFKSEREKIIFKLFLRGYNFTEIGKRLRLSRERIRQIISKVEKTDELKDFLTDKIISDKKVRSSLDKTIFKKIFEPYCIECGKDITEKNYLESGLCLECKTAFGSVSRGRKLFTKEIDIWRKEVFEENDFTCQKCDKKGGVLHGHHIFNWADCPHLRFTIDNGITFCKKCHRLFHHFYGVKHNNREQLNEFLQA